MGIEQVEIGMKCIPSDRHRLSNKRIWERCSSWLSGVPGGEL